MIRPSCRPLGVIACALLAAAAAAVSLWPLAGYVQTEDQNGDGRPDVWRVYDRQHQLSEVAVDTNFDGRSDVHEYYQRGALVRRESDRDFNDRVDLVQEFDPATSEPVRAVVDVDFDGTADLLVLFQGGQPVFSEWAHPVAAAALAGDRGLTSDAPARTGDDQLAPLEDPFSADLAVRAIRVALGADCVGLSTSGGLPSSGIALVSPLASASDVSGASLSRPPSVTVGSYSPRGPPVSPLIA